jgi:hypothetical protein
MLPTTIIGSLPRPSWYTESLGTRTFLDAMVDIKFRDHRGGCADLAELAPVGLQANQQRPRSSAQPAVVTQWQGTDMVLVMHADGSPGPCELRLSMLGGLPA